LGPSVLVPVPYTLKIRGGVEVDSAGKAAGKGALIQTNLSATLGVTQDQYLFQPVSYDARGNGDGSTLSTITGDHENRITDYSSVVVDPKPVIAFDRAAFNQGQNAKYDFEITDSGVNSTLVARGPSGVAYGFDPQADRDVGKYVHEETANTLVNGTCPGYKNGVAYSVDEKMGQTYTWEEQANTLAARDYKQPQAVAYPGENIRYIVRRLTPTECARLQGFADWWGIVEQKDSLTDEEYQFWLEVRNTHAAINGKKVQDYTEKQMLTWYNKLWTDSAEYKMWGNGIALPPALYCLQGIVDALNKPEEDDDAWLM
jgi:DNA (cytosine-5)-methyltransferase 1